MLTRILVATLAVTLSASQSLGAQTMVTFEMPVKLTQLSPDVVKVGLMCTIKSDAIVPTFTGTTAHDEVSAVGGQVVTTLRVVITFPQGSLQAPVGKTASYSCNLTARTTNGLGGFTEDPKYIAYLKPNPPPVEGTFVW